MTRLQRSLFDSHSVLCSTRAVGVVMRYSNINAFAYVAPWPSHVICDVGICRLVVEIECAAAMICLVGGDAAEYFQLGSPVESAQARCLRSRDLLSTSSTLCIEDYLFVIHIFGCRCNRTQQPVHRTKPNQASKT